MENQCMELHAAADATEIMYYLNSTATNHGNGDAESSSKLDDDENYLECLPPGFHFRPTDGELIVYLIKKIKNEKLPPNRIKEVNIYKFNPENLEDNFKLDGEKEMYFFSLRERKYKKGHRPTRTAVGGFWKATGADKIIEHNGEAVGFKKALVFFKFSEIPKQGKTSWIMHEYKAINLPPRQRINEDDMKLDWVLCKIYNNIRNPKTEDVQIQETNSNTNLAVVEQQNEPTAAGSSINDVQIQETNSNTNLAVVEQQNEPTAAGSSINVSPQEYWDLNNIESSMAMPNTYEEIGDVDIEDYNYDFCYDDHLNFLDDPQGSDFQSIPLNLDITNPVPISVMPPNNFLGSGYDYDYDYDYGQYYFANLQESIEQHQNVLGLPMMDTNGFQDFTHCPVLRGQHQENEYGFPTMDTSQVPDYGPLRHGPVPTGQYQENRYGIPTMDTNQVPYSGLLIRHGPVPMGDHHQENIYGIPTMETNQLVPYSGPLRDGPVPDSVPLGYGPVPAGHGIPTLDTNEVHNSVPVRHERVPIGQNQGKKNGRSEIDESSIDEMATKPKRPHPSNTD